MPRSTGQIVGGALLRGLQGGLTSLAKTEQAKKGEEAEIAKGLRAETEQQKLFMALGREDVVEKLREVGFGRAASTDELKQVFEFIDQRDEAENQENEQILQNLQDVGVDPADAAAQFFGQFREEAGLIPATDLSIPQRQAQREAVKPFFGQLEQLSDEDIIGAAQTIPGELDPQTLALLSERVEAGARTTREREAFEAASLKERAGQAARPDLTPAEKGRASAEALISLRKTLAASTAPELERDIRQRSYAGGRDKTEFTEVQLKGRYATYSKDVNKQNAAIEKKNRQNQRAREQGLANARTDAERAQIESVFPIGELLPKQTFSQWKTGFRGQFNTGPTNEEFEAMATEAATETLLEGF